MKKRRRLKKGLAMLLSLAMVVGLLPGMGTMKVFAAGTTSASGGEGKTAVTLTALYGYPAGDGGATYDKLLDGETNTRWECDLKYPSYVIFKASASINVNGYSMWTAHDTTAWYGYRNPVEWTLYGCNDYDEENHSGGTWEVIHTVTNGGLPNTNEAETKFTFDINKTTYQYFKLDITKVDQFERLRLGEFALTYCDHTWGSPIETLEPTCIDEGCMVYQCSRCQTTKRESTGKTALGHDFINGVCSRCHNGSTEPTKPEEKDGVYQIGKSSELYWFAQQVNSGKLNINAVLTSDITVNYNLLESLTYDSEGYIYNDEKFESWTPIGVNYNQSYTGTFDGQNHTISGLYFNDTSKDNVGLFGAVGSEGTIQNIGVVDSCIIANGNVAAVCGYNKGKITNCYNKGSVNSKGEDVGGVCGSNSGGTITGCYNTGTICGNAMYTGGVCGYNYGGLITDCYNTGAISGVSYTGGVCGNNYQSATITDCYNKGKVSGSSNYAAGVCALNYGGCTIKNSYNIGEISGNKDYVGGVSGHDGGTITNCYNEGKISGASYVGGLSGIISSGLITNSYSKGTVNSTSSSYTGGVYGSNDKGNAVNCYYLAENANNNGGRAKEQFYSGEVAYLLSQGCSIDTNTYDGSIWGQDLSKTNPFPELNVVALLVEFADITKVKLTTAITREV